MAWFEFEIIFPVSGLKLVGPFALDSVTQIYDRCMFHFSHDPNSLPLFLNHNAFKDRLNSSLAKHLKINPNF